MARVHTGIGSTVSALVFVAVGFLLAVLYVDLMFEMQVYTKEANDAAALDTMLAYYTRIFTAPYGPTGLLCMFAISSGGAAYRIYEKGYSLSRAAAVGLIITPQALGAGLLFPLCQKMILTTTSVDEQRDALKTLCIVHSIILALVLSFFVTYLVDFVRCCSDCDGKNGADKDK